MENNYVEPIFEESTEFNFTKEIWEELSNSNWCFGCTNCNCN